MLFFARFFRLPNRTRTCFIHYLTESCGGTYLKRLVVTKECGGFTTGDCSAIFSIPLITYHRA